MALSLMRQRVNDDYISSLKAQHISRAFLDNVSSGQRIISLLNGKEKTSKTCTVPRMKELTIAN